MWVRSLDHEDPVKESMTVHFSIFAWKIPWTEKPARLQFIGSQRVGHDWKNLAHIHEKPQLHILNNLCHNNNLFLRHWISGHEWLHLLDWWKTVEDGSEIAVFRPQDRAGNADRAQQTARDEKPLLSVKVGSLQDRVWGIKRKTEGFSVGLQRVLLRYSAE